MPSKLEKKLGRKVLDYADNDRWESCLSILRRDVRYQQEFSMIPNRNDTSASNVNQNKSIKIWLHGSTSFGDHLVHLCAFAACETSLSLTKRRKACYCLKLLLQWEGLKASQRVASDGGTALHGALASASSSLYNLDDDACSAEEEDEGGDDLDEIDLDWISKCQCEEEVHFMDDCSLDNKNLTILTISMLLDAGADPNTKLMNILSNTEKDEEDDEVELSYAREAIIQQWNPLIMVLVWASLSFKKQIISMETLDLEKELPYKVLNILLNSGADPSYEVGERVSPSSSIVEKEKFWHPIEFAAISLAGCLNQYQWNINFSPKINPIWDRVEELLIKSGSPALTDVQLFIIQILNNNVEEAKIQIREGNEDIFEKNKIFFSLPVEDFFPFPEIIFPHAGHHQKKTLFELACHLGALRSVHFFMTITKIEANHDISESLCRRAILSLYEFSLKDQCSSSQLFDEGIQTREKICFEIIDVYCYNQLKLDGMELTIESYQTDINFKILRQRFLDKLLLYTCVTRKVSTENSFNDNKALFTFLMRLGSDPNVKSIIDTQVQGKQTPLHIVAGNRNDSEGFDLMNLLLSSGSNINIVNENGSLPLEVGLIYRNYKIVQMLWKHHQEKPHNQTLSLDTYLSLKSLYMLGISGIYCHDEKILEFSVRAMRNKIMGYCDPDDDTLVSNYLGELLLRSIDPRSGFTSILDESNYMSTMRKVVLNDLLDMNFNNENKKKNKEHFASKQVLPSFVKSDVSQMTVFHFLLSQERFMAEGLRKLLLHPLCDWAKAIGCNANLIEADRCNEYEMKTNEILSSQCHQNFGGYTPLHLACVIECQESITTLLDYGADPKALDAEGYAPFDLIQNEDLKKSFMN